jgi:hypothetical protein
MSLETCENLKGYSSEVENNVPIAGIFRRIELMKNSQGVCAVTIPQIMLADFLPIL